ncbi:GNAT family N-acetyltransferase [Nonomuraea jiangxiensis]|uniref:Protein N-acetyltransferase, RimJ/RimL family n=1 Tax=Nonomuraea jiangxiensis TaxID=633440 RepID=A0A1G9JLI9_9ACTN|nr:GNAT family N-acetyltransferase [Nonomuraea jiangxiensis]SDL38427.1 Protein N-acetyltransferase, RimJ/RimL family [Nonomuraea jiangxiensis]
MPSLVPPVIAAGSLNNVPQPVLKAEPDLVMRPWTRADAPVILDAYSDPAVRHWAVHSVDTIAEAERLIDGYAEGWRTESSANWAVVTAAGEVLGRVALRAIDREMGQGEVAYWMLAAARGRGAATAAVRALSAWAFEAGIHRLFLMHSTRNEVSCRVAQKAGFMPEGTERSSILHTDGWHDMHIHALINPLPEIGFQPRP